MEIGKEEVKPYLSVYDTSYVKKVQWIYTKLKKKAV